MTKNNAINSIFSNNSDGFTLGGGVTSRSLTLTGSDVTLSGSANTTLTLQGQSGIVTLQDTLTFTAGSIPFANSTGLLSQDNPNFFWDNTNNRLGIGISSPVSKLHVAGDISLGSTGGNIVNIVFREVNPIMEINFDGTVNKMHLGSVAGNGEIITLEDASLRMGVGQTSPTSKLHIKGAGTTSTTSALNVTDSDGTSLLFVRDDGNVGIGTTSPDGIAQFRRPGQAGVRITSDTSASVLILTANKVSGVDNDAILRLNAGTSESLNIWSISLDNSDVDKMKIANGPNPQDNTVMTFTTAKDVGIGITTPNEKLEVGGKIRANTAFNLNGTDGISGIFTFGGGGTGEIASMTFSGGILTATTLVP